MSTKVYIFNTTILTTPGLTFHSEVIDAVQAQRLVAPAPGREVISAIGHEATAQVASAILGREVEYNRIAANMQDGDLAVCVKLRGRAPEGVILTREQIEAIGFDLVLLRAEDPARVDARRFALHMFMDWLALPDAPESGVQPRNTRRRSSMMPAQEHFVVRLSDGSYRRLVQEWGTDAWDEIPAVNYRVSGVLAGVRRTGRTMSKLDWLRSTDLSPASYPEYGDPAEVGVVLDHDPVGAWRPLANFGEVYPV